LVVVSGLVVVVVVLWVVEVFLLVSLEFAAPVSEDIDPVESVEEAFLWWCFLWRLLCAVPVVEPALAVSWPALLPFLELVSWPISEEAAPDFELSMSEVDEVEDWRGLLMSEGVDEVDGVAVLEGDEGEVVEVAPALPLTEPLCEDVVPAGCVQGWLLVLPVALPVVPPAWGVVDDVLPACGVVDEVPAALPVEALPLAEPLGLIEVPADGLCAGVAGVTLWDPWAVPCAAEPVWSVLVVLLGVLVVLLLGVLVWLWVPVARSVASGTLVRSVVDAPVVLPVCAWFWVEFVLGSVDGLVVPVCAIASPVPRSRTEVA
jgi:hypothetical protein